MSCLTNCQAISDFRNLANLKKTSEKSPIKGDNFSRKLKEKSPIKPSMERSTLLNFVNLTIGLLIIAIKKMQNFR